MPKSELASTKANRTEERKLGPIVCAGGKGKIIKTGSASGTGRGGEVVRSPILERRSSVGVLTEGKDYCRGKANWIDGDTWLVEKKKNPSQKGGRGPRK